MGTAVGLNDVQHSFATKEEFISAYNKLVLEVKDPSDRSANRETLKKQTLPFLWKADPAAKLCRVCREVLQQNINHDTKWESRRAVEVCRGLENIVLRLSDQPWRKEFHTIWLYSGYYRTCVSSVLAGDADRLLEMAGYERDLSGQQMLLKTLPPPEVVLTAAAELFLLGLELQIFGELLCLVQPEGFTLGAVLDCRLAIAGSCDQCVRWIKEHCSPGRPSQRPQSLPEDDDPIYFDIGEPSPSKSSSSGSHPSLKSAQSLVSNDGSSSSGGTSNSAAAEKPKSEPLYSTVNKPPKVSSSPVLTNPAVPSRAPDTKDSIPNSGALRQTDHLYGFDPPIARAPVFLSESSHTRPVSTKLPSFKDPGPPLSSLPVTFSTFRPPNESRKPTLQLSPLPESQYENINLMTITNGKGPENRRPKPLCPIPVQLPSAPVLKVSDDLDTDWPREESDGRSAPVLQADRKSAGMAAAISRKYDSVPPRRSPPTMNTMGNLWQCHSCTSFNFQGNEICDICRKSHTKGAEPISPVNGGPSCPQCTYINDVGAKACTVCATTFEGAAPTYI